MEIFVPDYDWNSHWNSVAEAVEAGEEFDEYPEGEEFTMVRLTVGARTTYKIVNGEPVPISIGFPKSLPPNA